ncbi:MAG: hypothetical protein KJ801_15895, partial [Alphaproteobacteria bacterium]|nr:hypothetical protein [Alphaproteobacteria bacterium]
IRRVWDIDLKDISASHLHPADLGGAIVSVDQPKPAGEWRWAGPDWRHRSVVGRLTGAELTSPDPMRLMARWASALGAGGSGNSLEMDDGDIVFSQGDVERLVSFDLSLPDSEAVLARATDAGLEVDGRSVRVAGVEMRLA